MTHCLSRNQKCVMSCEVVHVRCLNFKLLLLKLNFKAMHHTGVPPAITNKGFKFIGMNVWKQTASYTFPITYECTPVCHHPLDMCVSVGAQVAGVRLPLCHFAPEPPPPL